MHTHDIVVPVDTLRELIGRILMAVGCRAEDAQTTATVLLEADLRGYATHGLLRLPMMVQRMQSGMIAAQAQPRIVTEREGAALVDAGRALRPVGVVFGADLAVRKAKRAGSYTVGVVNSDHIGMAGYYVERIAQAGCVGILAGVTQPLVHPLGGTERLLGTNPLAIAIPGGQDTPPVLLTLRPARSHLARFCKQKPADKHYRKAWQWGQTGSPPPMQPEPHRARSLLLVDIRAMAWDSSWVCWPVLYWGLRLAKHSVSLSKLVNTTKANW